MMPSPPTQFRKSTRGLGMEVNAQYRLGDFSCWIISSTLGSITEPAAIATSPWIRVGPEPRWWERVNPALASSKAFSIFPFFICIRQSRAMAREICRIVCKSGSNILNPSLRNLAYISQSQLDFRVASWICSNIPEEIRILLSSSSDRGPLSHLS